MKRKRKIGDEESAKRKENRGKRKKANSGKDNDWAEKSGGSGNRNRKTNVFCTI